MAKALSTRSKRSESTNNCLKWEIPPNTTAFLQNLKSIKMRSSVLINEPPILVLPTLASEIGLNEAMVLQQIHYWLNNERIKNHFNGQTWVRNTYDQWRRQFPFWGEKTLRRAFSSLEEQQLVQSFISNEEFRKTKFYTIQYDNVEKLDLGHRPYIREKTPTASSI